MKKLINEFKDFAVRGNAIDLAVGIIIGAAFNKIVTSLVNDIILPPIGLVLKKVDFSNLYINLGDREFESLKMAQDAGAPTINYGLFVNALISFLITAFAVFLLIKQINRLKRKGEKASPNTPHCPFCDLPISPKAVRCPHCTSSLDHVTQNM